MVAGDRRRHLVADAVLLDHQPPHLEGAGAHALLRPPRSLRLVTSSGGMSGIVEVAVVVGRLLDAHRHGDPARLVVAQRRLLHRLLARVQLDLPLRLGLDGAAQRGEAVQVLELGLGAQRASRPRGRTLMFGSQRKLPALHRRVADRQALQQAAQLVEVAHALRRIAEVRLADDLQQRHAGAVVVQRRRAVRQVEQLGRVLLQVHAGEARLARLVAGASSAARRRGQRQVVLADLVALGQVGIEVVLAREDAALVDRAAQLAAPASARAQRPGGWGAAACPDGPGRPGRRNGWPRSSSAGVRPAGQAQYIFDAGTELGVHFQPDDDLPSRGDVDCHARIVAQAGRAAMQWGERPCPPALPGSAGPDPGGQA